MKRFFTLLFLSCISFFASAQDIGVVSIDSPISGCGLTASETVVIKITNFGSTDLSGVPFSATYKLNTVPTTEVGITFASFLPNSTVTYSFTTPANLSAPGLYVVDANTTLGTDINTSNDALNGVNVTNDAPSVGGSVAPVSQTVCSGANSGTLTLSSNTGAVIGWEYSTDGGTTWLPISNTATTNNFLNLTTTTLYHAIVQNGVCAAATSANATVTVVPVSVGGTVASNATVCSGSNSGTLTLSGHTGSVIRWEKSIDNGVTWTPIVNTTTSQTYLNLTQTTLYHAIVQSGACAQATSSNVTITVNPTSLGGNVTPSVSTVCSGSNSGVLTLNGNNGPVLNWEYSIDGGNTWITISNTTSTQAYNNVSTLTQYRAVVQSGVCPSVASVVGIINVTSPTVGGTVTANATVCSGANSGTLTLGGQTGTVLSWEKSIDNGVTWTPIVNTTTSQTYLNLVTTTLYRAAVQNGSCSTVNSAAATITVNPVSVGGTVTANATVCSGANSGTLTLAGHTGSIIRWEYSTDGGVTYFPISNTTTTYNYNNLITTTYYRAVLQSGVCATANSNPAIITVTPATVAGSVTANATVCSGSNSGTLSLGGSVGSVLSWEFSIDNGVTWTAIGNTTTSQNYLNLITTTLYHAVVRSGACTTLISSAATITVTPNSVGGTVTSNAVVCSGVNNGTLNLSGQTGSVIRWEYSTDGGITWIPISNTTTGLTYNNITVTTKYRAVVQNGSCTISNSSASTITVSSTSVGGTVNSNTTVCSGSNAGTVFLTGQNGNVLSWEFSINGGVTWNPITNTTTSQSYSNIVTTTMYHAVVQNPGCSTVISNPVTITVIPGSVGGTLTSNATVCSGANSGTITLAGNVGSILRWEISTDGGTTWFPISNTTTAQNYLNLTATTMYRAVSQNGSCPSQNSNAVTITVNPATVAGSVTANTTVCANINAGTVMLGGQTGSILSWEYSTDGGFTWTAIVNTTTSQNYLNLTTTTMYHAIVQSGNCASLISSPVTITVDPVVVGGTVTANATVCSGNNNGTLTLAGQTGSVIRWEFSTDGGTTWIPVSNTTTSLGYNNLTMTTLYHAVVQSGACGTAVSSNDTITVTPMSVAGAINQPAGICAGTNWGTLTLTGYVGNVTNWLVSTDNGVTWNANGNTDDTLQYMDLTDTTMYMAIVQSGLCSSDTTAAITIIVYPKPVAAFTTTDVCFGNTTSFSNTSTITGNSVIMTYLWDFGDNTTSATQNPTHLYGAAGTYNVTFVVTSDWGCLDTTNIFVNVNAPPAAVVTSNPALQFCAGDSIQLSANAIPNCTYVWSTGATTTSVFVDSSGSFSVTVTDTVVNCSTIVTVNATQLPLPVVTASNDTTLTLGTPITLNATGGGTYSWMPLIVDDPNSQNPTATPTVNTTFTVIVTGTNGCISSDSVKVDISTNNLNLSVSNLMTTNGDGFNDNFWVENISYFKNNEVAIFNRNGQQVFQTTGYQNNWDGTFNGKPLPDGTYYYVVKLTDLDITYKGSVTIMSK